MDPSRHRVVPRLDVLEGRSLPSTFGVYNLADSGVGSLRQAIFDANANAGADTIAFDSTFFSTPRAITLTSGQLTITDSLAIAGPGADRLTVSGNNASRIFNIDGPGVLTVNLSGLTLTGGRTNSWGGAIAIQDEKVTVSDSVITGNTAAGSGGGAIAELGTYPTSGSLIILGSTVSGNSAGAGGAIFAGSRTLVIRDSTVSGNTSNQSGGAIDFSTYDFGSSLTVKNSTLSGNTAVIEGGAISFYAGLNGSLVVQNSTISGNRAGNDGGGIAFSTYLPGALLVQNSTITANSVTGTAIGQGGGGIAATFSRGITVVSSIVSGNVNANAPDILSPGTAPVDVNFSAIGSAAGHTLSAKSGNNLPYAANLYLGPLANNGGPTQTHALLGGSLAINAGDPAATGDYDQRGPGFARIVGGRTDIGAFEVQAPYVTGTRINGGDAQRSRVTEITITFNQVVTFAGSPTAAFRLSRTGPGGPRADVALAADLSASTTTQTIARLSFSGALTEFDSLIDGRYTLTVLSGQVSAGGVALDGDADGTPGGDLTLKLYRRYGDANGDGAVNDLDLKRLRHAFGTVSTDATYLTFLDFDGDGVINGADLKQFRSRFGVAFKRF